MTGKRKRTVCSVTYERNIKWSPIHEQIASDHTNVLPLCECIEGGCFSGTARAHESGQSSRLDVPVDIVQDTKGTAGHGNHVVDVLPSEGLAIWEGPLLGWDADFVDLFSGVLSLLKCLVESLGFVILLPEDRDVRSSIGALHKRISCFRKHSRHGFDVR